ncbi:hypothetical protein Arub01_25170 [Actinomadura rubrobrunea]|uniref:NADP-dependent oxidoreductase domain-containing protein n=2 Tax=Actinomadura rubrobrunea TaxID=115335 RepID=A0A9W6PWH2_9ACTN|nr:hypothetical protein Arub01_25170 [Actinomadura rubrobrunea]
MLAGTRSRGGGRHTLRARTDRYAELLYTDESDFDIADAVRAVAGERGVTMARVALAWLLDRPGVVSPIIGAGEVAHLAEAVAATGLTLTDEEKARLEAPYRPHPISGHE